MGGMGPEKENILGKIVQYRKNIIPDSSISHVCINRHVFNVDTYKSV